MLVSSCSVFSKLDFSVCLALAKLDSLPVIEFAALLLTTDFFFFFFFSCASGSKGKLYTDKKHLNTQHTDTHTLMLQSFHFPDTALQNSKIFVISLLSCFSTVMMQLLQMHKYWTFLLLLTRAWSIEVCLLPFICGSRRVCREDDFLMWSVVGNSCFKA